MYVADIVSYLWELECYSCMYKGDVWWFVGGPSLLLCKLSCHAAILCISGFICYGEGVFLYAIFDGILQK